LILYRLPRREINAPRTAGERVRPRELRSACASELLPDAMDDDLLSMWQCPWWDERQALTVDLGEMRTVGSVVTNLGPYAWLFPSALAVATSQDGKVWQEVWTGTVLDRTILAGMADPKQLRIVVAFPQHQARYIIMRAASSEDDAPWSIAELEVWSSSESR
jgi:hypothetical protein